MKNLHELISLSITVLIITISGSSAFVTPSPSNYGGTIVTTTNRRNYDPAGTAIPSSSCFTRTTATSDTMMKQPRPVIVATRRRRQQQSHRSASSTALFGLFGLGGPEIAVILIAAAFLLGPEKLADLGKDAGKIAGELKDVPKEFQKGLEEGEKIAKAKGAKVMQEVPPSGDDGVGGTKE
mmetsp:Transcript_21581/g.26715  ORF Transcript_21581/g.26715 Transcript_21581/m.26715 type:complete len:181 (+) Transcript_21581:148-690(+)|eukprot:CAMPEP_0172513370 /NCGR_PEP_ID=MMETSP1066-20121228/251988_1 /TAXON_ID=671091 /ORGANISM="Coscinodiscus wailesii, Strain CCMP2513" /LENGTH=180 /DNA_ID=CAMNT_0013293601 /DNA_START=125 /DNA_END=667 /DNA_ORIENTATION=+